MKKREGIKFFRNSLIAIIAGSLLLLSLSGCWNRREIDTISILMGMGIDKAEGANRLQLTAQVIKPSQMKKDGGSRDKEAFLTVKSTGDTVFDALRNFTKETTRKIYLPHSQILIFGEEIAVEGVQKYTDFFIRDHEPRLRTNVLVAKGRAEDILAVKSKLEEIPAAGISDLLNAQSATSEAMKISLKRFINCLISDMTSPTAPIVEISGSGEEKFLNISGMALFKNDKLVGEMIGSEARGLLWIMNEVESGIIVVECPLEECYLSLEIIRSTSKIIPQFRDGKISVKVEIKEEGHIGDQECVFDLTMPIISDIEQRKAAVIRNEVMAAVRKAQDLGTDVFGFGEAVHRKYPRQWKEMKKKWDYIYPELEVEVIVNAKVRRPGMLTRPASS